MKFERHHQNYCGHEEDLEVLGSGGGFTKRKGVFYNGYYCPKCKKVYLEDCYFSKPIRLFYSKKATIDYLRYLELEKLSV